MPAAGRLRPRIGRAPARSARWHALPRVRLAPGGHATQPGAVIRDPPIPSLRERADTGKRGERTQDPDAEGRIKRQGDGGGPAQALATPVAIDAKCPDGFRGGGGADAKAIEGTGPLRGVDPDATVPIEALEPASAPGAESAPAIEHHIDRCTHRSSPFLASTILAARRGRRDAPASLHRRRSTGDPAPASPTAVTRARFCAGFQPRLAC